MTVQEFITFFNGIYCDYDGAYGDQCFDLANGYSRWIGGQRFTGDNAYQIFDQAGIFYDQIVNAKDNFPLKGDIVIWAGSYNGGAGHVGIATGENTDVNGFDALEQNDPLGSNCHIKHYSYRSVLGWFHPKSLPLENQGVVDELRKARDDNWNLYQEELKRNTNLMGENQGLKTQLSQVNLADATLLENYKKKFEEDSTAIDSGIKAEKDRQSLFDQLHVANVEDALKAIAALQKPHEEVVKNVQPIIEGLADAAIKKTRSPIVKSNLQKIIDTIKNILHI